MLKWKIFHRWRTGGLMMIGYKDIVCSATDGEFYNMVGRKL